MKLGLQLKGIVLRASKNIDYVRNITLNLVIRYIFQIIGTNIIFDDQLQFLPNWFHKIWSIAFLFAKLSCHIRHPSLRNSIIFVEIIQQVTLNFIFIFNSLRNSHFFNHSYFLLRFTHVPNVKNTQIYLPKTIKSPKFQIL